MMGEGNRVVGLLALRVDPQGDFSRILQRGRLGKSGETYAFDQSGRLISEHRFEEQLRRIGLIGEGGLRTRASSFAIPASI